MLRKKTVTGCDIAVRRWLVEPKGDVWPKEPAPPAAPKIHAEQWDALNRYTPTADMPYRQKTSSERTLKLRAWTDQLVVFGAAPKGGKTAAVCLSFQATCKI